MKRRSFVKAAAGTIIGAPMVLTKASPLGTQALSPIAVMQNSGASTVGTSGGAVSMDLVPATVNSLVDGAVKKLAGVQSVGAAWQACFQGLTTSSKIAIKINMSFDFYSMYKSTSESDSVPICPWGAKAVVIEAIVSGLVQMLDGTYPIKNITVFDKATEDTSEDISQGSAPFHGRSCRNSMAHQGFPASDTEFDYHVSGEDKYTAWLVNFRPLGFLDGMPTFSPQQTVLPTVVNNDYMINVGIPKDHSMAGYTGVIKNLFGCTNQCDQAHDDIHNCLPDFLDEITKLCPCPVYVVDALAGNHSGGAIRGTLDDVFSPNAIAMTPDPLTAEYYGLKLVNDERSTDITTGSGSSGGHPNAYFLSKAQTKFPQYNYNAGDSNATSLRGIGMEPLASLQTPQGRVAFVKPFPGGWRLTVQLDASGRRHQIDSAIYNVSGREIRSLRTVSTRGARADLEWNGLNNRGSRAGSGTFIWQVRIDGRVYNQKIRM